jgi:hypothetical protein
MSVPQYANTGAPATVGDLIEYDGHLGRIVLVCLPNTQESRDYACEHEGGLLIDFEEYGLVLEPFSVLDSEVLLKVLEQGEE